VRLVDAAAPSRGRMRTLVLDPAWLDERPPRGEAVFVGGDDDVAVVHASSGTTGAPRAVAVTHAQLASRVATLSGAVPMAERARVLCTAHATSCYGLDTFLRVLHGGGAIAVASRADDVATALARDRVEHLTLNPLWVERLVALVPPGARPFPSLARIESAGSRLARPLAEAARASLCDEVWNHYGTTEAGCIGAAAIRADDPDGGMGVRAAPGVEVGAVDADGSALPPGAHGRLRARGPGFADRYLDDAIATADAFRDGWHVTADEGTVSDDGVLRIAGRLGESIDVGGYKLSPRTIEDALLSIGGVSDAAAFGVASATGVDELWAAVVIGAAVTRDALSRDIGARLGAFAPRVVVTIGEIPRNEAGKVRRDELVVRARAAQASSAG
jgi:acyl-coenzyme A synthetase/AMP-(fatty) acid ligase